VALSRNLKTVARWSVKWQWPFRAAQYDGDLDRREREALFLDRLNVNKQHAVMAKVMRDLLWRRVVGYKPSADEIAKAEAEEKPIPQEVTPLDLNGLTPHQWGYLFAKAVDLEREAAGMNRASAKNPVDEWLGIDRSAAASAAPTEPNSGDGTTMSDMRPLILVGGSQEEYIAALKRVVYPDGEPDQCEADQERQG